MRIAVIGGGVMGEALIRGLLTRSPAPSVVVAEKVADRAAALATNLGVTIAEPADAVANADVIVLAVKPQDLPSLLDVVGGSIAPGTLLVSIAAGIPTSTITARVPAGVNVVRAMPNTPARIGLGLTGVSAAPGCTDTALAAAVDLLRSVGTVVVVPEAQQDALTATSGSGPAYLFLLAEAMLEGAIGQGIDPTTADTMVRQTLLGAASLLSGSTDDPATLRRQVTSPNGTTAAALAVMDDRAVRAGVVAGMQAAADRSRELAGS